MSLLEKIDRVLNEEKSIDWSKVKEAMMNAAEDIFDEVDKKKIEGMLTNVKKHKPDDTESAIQIGIDMMRSD